MNKYAKEVGIPKPSTVKRIDPDPIPHKKSKRSKKEYPPCWNVRHSGWGYSLDAHATGKPWSVYETATG